MPQKLTAMQDVPEMFEKLTANQAKYSKDF